VAKAKVMLEESQKEIGEIAFEVGFPSHSHFTKIFHKMTGATPSQFRQGLVDELPCRHAAAIEVSHSSAFSRKLSLTRPSPKAQRDFNEFPSLGDAPSDRFS